MDFEKLIELRRSIRKFQNRRISKEALDLFVKAAMYAPSARNRRPVHLILIDDKRVIEKLRKLRENAFTFLETAPFAIVVTVKNYDTWESDGAIVASYIQLMATNLGLGSCWGHIAERVEEEAKTILGIPEDFRVLCVLGIGYPAESKPPHTEEEIDPTRIHKNCW